MEPQNDPELTAFLADFQARWQELLNLETEVGTWTTVYATAFFVTVAWVLSRKGIDEIKVILQQSFSLDPLLLFAVAFLNGLFALGIAVRSYGIHEIALYIFTDVKPRIASVIGEQFSTWEEWRHPRAPGWGRNLYYGLWVAAPIVVSGFILGSYGKYHWRDFKARRWAFPHMIFYGVVLTNVLCLIAAIIMMTLPQQQWREAIRHRAERGQLVFPTKSANDAASRQVISGLWRVDAAVRIAGSAEQAEDVLISGIADANNGLSYLANGDVKASLTRARDLYVGGIRIWNTASGKPTMAISENDRRHWMKAYGISAPDLANDSVRTDVILDYVWETARVHVLRATDLLARQSR